ncbi:chitin deacetylase [Mortierella sp. AD094]|nr:chitin deacetylase [Mortierella sp. AD094]
MANYRNHLRTRTIRQSIIFSPFFAAAAALYLLSSFPNPCEAAPNASLRTLKLSEYPPQSAVPPVDSPQVKKWLSEIDLSGAPSISLNSGEPPNCPDTVDEGVCYWTCYDCSADDVVDCPDKNTWGLTFDDGPTPATPELLRFLDEQKVKATFFLIGSNVVQHPDIVQAEVKAGHHLASHTKQSKKRLDTEFDTCALHMATSATAFDLFSESLGTQSSTGLVTPSIQKIGRHDFSSQTVSVAKTLIPFGIKHNLQIMSVAQCLHDNAPYAAVNGTPMNVSGVSPVSNNTANTPGNPRGVDGNGATTVSSIEGLDLNPHMNGASESLRSVRSQPWSALFLGSLVAGLISL